MFSNISWSTYVIAVSIIIIVWYGFVIFKYHSKRVRDIFSVKKSSVRTDAEKELFSEYPESFSTLEDAKELSILLINAIQESNQLNRPQKEFRTYLKLILNDFPFVKTSYLREKVTTLMVSECEKYPQLMLTYKEADALWGEI